MRVQIEIDDDLLAEAMRLAGPCSIDDLVNQALRELVARHRRKDVRELFGKDLIDPNYDYKKARS